MSARWVTWVVVLGFAATPAFAQDYPLHEVFLGASAFNIGENTIYDTDSDGTEEYEWDGQGRILGGWQASYAYNVNQNLGLVADLGGQYDGSQSDFDSSSTDLHSYMTHQFLFGPRLNARSGTVTAFVHFLVGASTFDYDQIDTEFDGSINSVEDNVDETTFSHAFGGGIDVAVNDVISVRAIQVDLISSHFGEVMTDDMTSLEHMDHHLRFGFGVTIGWD